MIKSSLLYFTANIASAILGFIGLTIFTRLITPTDYAFYVLTLATGSLLTPWLFTWVRIAVLQDQSENPFIDMRKTVFTALLIIMPITAISAYFLQIFFNTNNVPFFILFIVVYSVGSYEILLELLRARQDVKNFTYTVILRASLYLCVGLLLANHYHGYSLIYAFICAYTIGVIFILSKFTYDNISAFDPIRLKDWVRRSPGATLIAVVLAVYSVIDRFLINTFLGESAVGQFVASQDITRQILVAPSMAIGSIFIPKAINLFNVDKKALEKHMQYGLNLFMIVLLPSSLGLALVGADLSQYFLGKAFAEVSYLVIPFCALGFFLQNFNNAYFQSIYHCHKVYWPISLQMIFNVLCLYTLLIYLIPTYGLYGAALSFFISECLNTILSYFLVKLFYKGAIFSNEFYKIISLNAIIGAIAFFLLPYISIWLIILLYITFYSAGVLLLNLLDARSILKVLKRP